MTAPQSTIVVILTGVFLGVFAGLIAGIVGYNGLSTIGPRTTAEARLIGYEVEYHQSGSTSESRRTRWVNGVTDSGRTWRIASDDAYDVASRRALPMDVEVTISDWSGATIALHGPGLDVDRTGIVSRLGWIIASALVAAVVLLIDIPILRSSTMSGVAYLAGAPVGFWLGFIVLRWYRG
ncbi:MAG: hypothetical protein R2715_00700 [Ilumatobacteraceae bacterium]